MSNAMGDEMREKSLFEKVAAEIGALVTEKNAAYGDSFAKCGLFLRLLYPNGIQPAQYEDCLCMCRIFDKQMRIATRKDAFGESPYNDIAGYGILGIAKDQTQSLFDTSSTLHNTSEAATPSPIEAPSTSSVEEMNPKAFGLVNRKADYQPPMQPTAPPRPEQIAREEKNSNYQFNASLPEITLPVSPEEEELKFEEELEEWQKEEEGIQKLVELWDVAQVADTLQRLEKKTLKLESPFTPNKPARFNAITVLQRLFEEGHPVIEAKAAMLMKNALRGYYSEDVNYAIIMTGGKRIAPLA